jgi:N-acyl-D-amino-acid deacylase
VMGVPSPPGAGAIVRYMMGQPLQSAPGRRYAYSNFGYCVLGRIVERVSGQRYEEYVESHVLRPAGIRCMRLGRTLPQMRAPHEVRYFGYPGLGTTRTVFGASSAGVPWPYGGWSIEAMDSHGGWIASAVDLARFITALEGRDRHPPILRPESIRRMLARPEPAPLGTAPDTWYGMGWQVRPADGDANWWHAGSLDGTSSLMVRAANGLTWVVLFNSRPKLSDPFAAQLDNAMWKALQAVRTWPEHDLWQDWAACQR